MELVASEKKTTVLRSDLTKKKEMMTKDNIKAKQNSFQLREILESSSKTSAGMTKIISPTSNTSKSSTSDNKTTTENSSIPQKSKINKPSTSGSKTTNNDDENSTSAADDDRSDSLGRRNSTHINLKNFGRRIVVGDNPAINDNTNVEKTAEETIIYDDPIADNFETPPNSQLSMFSDNDRLMLTRINNQIAKLDQTLQHQMIEIMNLLRDISTKTATAPLPCFVLR